MKLNLDLSGVQVFGTKTVVPAGRYSVTVSAAEVKETKAGGAMVIVKFQVLDGEYKGALIEDNYNIINDNETAVRIGRGKLKAILKHGGADNIEALNDTDELLGLCLDISVTEEEESFTNDEGELIEFKKNYVQGFMPRETTSVQEEKEEKAEKKVEKKESPKKEVKKEAKKEDAGNLPPWLK